MYNAVEGPLSILVTTPVATPPGPVRVSMIRVSGGAWVPEIEMDTVSVVSKLAGIVPIFVYSNESVFGRGDCKVENSKTYKQAI